MAQNQVAQFVKKLDEFKGSFSNICQLEAFDSVLLTVSSIASNKESFVFSGESVDIKEVIQKLKDGKRDFSSQLQKFQRDLTDLFKSLEKPEIANSFISPQTDLSKSVNTWMKEMNQEVKRGRQESSNRVKSYIEELQVIRAEFEELKELSSRLTDSFLGLQENHRDILASKNKYKK